MALHFGIDDYLTTLGLSLTHWQLVGAAPRKSRSQAVAGGRMGDVLEETAFAKRMDYQVDLVADADDIADMTLTLGGVGTGNAEPKFILTQFRLRQIADDQTALSLTIHKHDDASITDKSHLARAYTVTLPNLLGYGVQSLVGCSNVSIPDEITLVEHVGSIVHKDKIGRLGKFITGVSTRGLLTETITLTDSATPVVITWASGWIEDDDSANETGEAYDQRVIAAHLNLTADE